MMKEAVVAILRKDNKILCITRKDDHNDFGIPGGAVEDGETVYDAIVREVLEETGILIRESTLIDCRVDNNTLIYLFMVSDYIENYAPIDPKETAIFGWYHHSKTHQSSFGKYNQGICNLYL